MIKGTAPYQEMPEQARFWFYNEQCYTSEELNFRQWILTIRSHSGIHSDHLANPCSWFAEDSMALMNVYEHSWIYPSGFKPRHTLTRDDFYVQPMDEQHIHWPALYELMQQTGDYLLKRNRNLSPQHLNQPMNYVLLDVNLMLKALSRHSNIEHVKEQLELITRYVRSIEKNITPLIGSDRLFLANLRGVIHSKIMPHIMHTIESRLLQERLHQLSKIIKKISAQRNQILHFALNAQPVNPHPYDFSIDTPEHLIAYPTQAVKACLIEQENKLPLEPVTHSLKECTHVEFLTKNDETEDHYIHAIADLTELEHFQKIINQINGLLSEAGEVYTIYQFKQQMLDLFEQINSFLTESSVHIKVIIDANTQAYHQAIQDQQNMPLWKKWLTQDSEKINNYITNQDNLARFPAELSELDKTNAKAQEHAKDIIRHLNQPKITETNFAALADKVQELDKLMGTMHHWITNHNLNQGLPAPTPPVSLKLILEKPQPPTFFTPKNTDYSDLPQPLALRKGFDLNNPYAMSLLIFIPTLMLGLLLLMNKRKSGKASSTKHETESEQSKETCSPDS